TILLLYSFCYVTVRYTIVTGPYKCIGAGNGNVRTFDGYLKSIFAKQKTLISQWGFPGDRNTSRNGNPCRYKLRVVTSWNETGSNRTLFFDWAAFGFDVKKKNNKPTRNLVLGQCDNIVLERGRGIQGSRVRPVARERYLYYRKGFTVYVFRDFTGNIKIRSTTCEYAFNWLPRGKDTTFTLWIGESYRDGSLL
ncbi:hypothetical protein LSH36_25g06031, partial [Paralvinella palmiformis]